MSTNLNPASHETEFSPAYLQARWAIRLVTCLLGLFAVVSFLLFAYQSACRVPPYGDLYRDQPLAWWYISGHLLRGCVASWLFVCLVRHLGELQNQQSQPQPDFNRLFATGARGWRAMAWSALAMLGYGILFSYDVNVGFPRLTARSSSSLPSLNKNSIKIEMRLAANETKEEWDNIEMKVAGDETRNEWEERVMIVTEPVRKVIQVSKETIIETKDISSARVKLDENGNRSISVTLTDIAADKLLAATTQNIGRKLAFILNDEVKAMPVIRDAIGKQFEITGSFTETEATQITAALSGDGRE